MSFLIFHLSRPISPVFHFACLVSHFSVSLSLSFPCNNPRNSTKEMKSMTKEALDTGDEIGKESLEELKTEFEPLTEWMKKVLSDARHSDFHIFVADVVKSFDTVDGDILDCALGRLGLPAWFRRVYFSFHRDVRLRFKLAAGLGVAWKRDGGIPQGCPLSMVFIVALYTPWCRYLEVSG